MAQFRNLTNTEGNSLVNNDRAVQPVNQRTVYSSVDLVFRFDCPPLKGKR